MIAEGISVTREHFKHSKDAVQMRYRRRYHRLCAQVAASATIDVRIGIGRVTSPAHACARAQSGDTVIGSKLNTQIRSGDSRLGMTNQPALSSERQRGTVGTGDGASTFYYPAHRGLKLRKRMRQGSASDATCRRVCELVSARGERNLTRGQLSNFVLLKNVLHNTVDGFVTDEPRPLVVTERATEDSAKHDERSAPAGQAVGRVVVAHQFALHAENGVSQFEESYISGLKMWH